jgi:hypothetical protein
MKRLAAERRLMTITNVNKTKEETGRWILSLSSLLWVCLYIAILPHAKGTCIGKVSDYVLRQSL